MKIKQITLALLACTITAAAQIPERTNHFPVGSFHKKNSNIHGIGVGLYSGIDEGPKDIQFRNVHINGIKLEAIGLGILVPLMPSSPVAQDEEELQEYMATPLSEKVNGLNISPAGTASDCFTNGISAGLIAQVGRQVNGISASTIMNFAQKHNGIQVAMFNEAYVMNGLQLGLANRSGRARGLQIGLVNHSTNFKGVQLGFWNTNQKRKLPILNWNFSR
ncbi:hypothetical protein GJU39_23125 [Pedobacter petrophilus]|uniref:DUF5723 domain-containing protein n=1 Tax=Pedobacter petrophilus TaxID=1908241 RepID=A0A7K0G6Y4_9SPHI|nr:hypothetical protein [Pedobacter petrophilus]MRX78959.1 hypothetical protein [Pedobacter petrophilus]